MTELTMNQQLILDALSQSSWRSATDIKSSISHPMKSNSNKSWIVPEFKTLEGMGLVEKMKNKNRAFYRLKTVDYSGAYD